VNLININKRKIFKCGLRITPGGSNVLDGLVKACNGFNIRLNGDGEVSASAFLVHLWEKAAETPEKTQLLENMLKIMDLKHSGKPIDPDLRKLIIKEVLDDNNRHQ
jgi:hypothetical protein